MSTTSQDIIPMDKDTDSTPLDGARPLIPEAQETDTSEQLAVNDKDVHPNAVEIRRQVEYYFSDQNLPTDKHLLSLCGGLQNLPVALGEIMSWRNMRKLIDRKSKQARRAAVNALKESDFLEIVNDDRCVRRRVPLDAALISAERQLALEKPVEEPVPAYLTKGMLKPTGFELNFCDAPITPAEHKENLVLYDPDSHFTERIECAIQRYKARRKFHQDVAYIFDSFMSYGGVDCGPRQFGGVSDRDMEGMDAQQIALLKATHFVDNKKLDDEKWAVDFEGVAKAYLSSYYPIFVRKQQSDDEIELATRVMTNFYNYLLHHGVCPEYMTDILAARAICTRAVRELSAVDRMTAALPGDFNKTCSVVFGGYHSRKGDFSESQISRWNEESTPFDVKEAQSLVHYALSCYQGDFRLGQIDELLQDDERVELGDRFHCAEKIAAFETGFEITHIELPTKVSKMTYAKLDNKFKTLKPQPLGKVVLKRWQLPDYSDYDLPPVHVMAQADGKTQSKAERIEIWLEAEILEHAFVGMKLAGELRRMVPVVAEPSEETCNEMPSRGFWYIDTVSGVYCSFHTELLNELKVKDARVKWLIGPDSDDVHVDETDKVVAGDQEDDEED